MTNFILAVPSTEVGHMSLIYLGKLTERKVRAHQSSNSPSIQSSALLYSHKMDKNWQQLLRRASKCEYSIQGTGS